MSIKNEPWKSDNWWVSPWDFMEEVTKDFKPPKQVKVHDVTLRDGEQQAGIIFTKDDKIRIAEKLAEAGVQRIEAGMPVVSPEDEAAVREIVKRNLGSEIFAFCRSTVDDVKRAADCGVKGVVIEIPTSQHIIEYGYGWPLEQAIERAIKATQAAKAEGLYTSFFTVDGSRTERNWYFNFIEKVAREGHMDALVVVDTYGVLTPQGASYFIKKIKERIDVPLEVHFHNHFGMAVANTVTAVASGAEVIQTTVTGIGEASGNCNMEEAVVALRALYGIETGIKYNKLYELSKFVRELSCTPANRPFVGDRVYTIESGISTHSYRNVWDKHPLVKFPVLPRFVGHPEPEIVMGKKSGIDNVEIWADKLDIRLTKEEAREVVAQVKMRASNIRRLLTEDEFREIAQAVKTSTERGLH